MKKIIEGIVYNTETAELIAEQWNGCDRSDFNFLNEELYRTKNGRYFLFGESGAASKYATVGHRLSDFGETIIPLSKNELFEFLQEWNEVQLIEALFPDKIQEA